MYFISLFIVYGNFILFFALIFCTGFEWNIFLYGIFMKKCSIFFTASLPRTALLLSSVSTISLSRREASRPPAAAGLHLSSESGTESLNCHLNYCCTAPHISQHTVHYEKTEGVRQLYQQRTIGFRDTAGKNFSKTFKDCHEEMTVSNSAIYSGSR